MIIVARIRCSSHCLRVETGRRESLPYDEHVCFLCDKEEVEDESKTEGFVEEEGELTKKVL